MVGAVRAMIAREKVEELMRRAQRGVGGPSAVDQAHDFMADAYGVLGRLLSERDALERELSEATLQATRRARDEIADRLLSLSYAMGKTADLMRFAELGDECDGHAQEMAGAARLAREWAAALAEGE